MADNESRDEGCTSVKGSNHLDSEVRAHIQIRELRPCSCQDPECPNKKLETFELPSFAYIVSAGFVMEDGRLGAALNTDGSPEAMVQLGAKVLGSLAESGLLVEALAIAGIGVASVSVGGLDDLLRVVASHSEKGRAAAYKPPRGEN